MLMFENPSSFNELVARVRAVMNTVTPRVSKPHDYANHMFMRL
jgi:hypothetical protein